MQTEQINNKLLKLTEALNIWELAKGIFYPMVKVFLTVLGLGVQFVRRIFYGAEEVQNTQYARRTEKRESAKEFLQ